MSGELILSDMEATWIATAGWDAKVVIYRNESSTVPSLGAPFATISMQTNPESMVFLIHPENGQLILVVTRRDSTFLHYYTVESTPRLLGKQNLAPYSNAWIAFTPAAIDLCPTDPTLLAVATSTIPHMKLIIVRLLFPPYDPLMAAQLAAAAIRPNAPSPTTLLDDATAQDPLRPTAASVARAALATQDREAAAIQIHCTTLAPQTAYSTPALAWRPNGTGVWVNSDDGAIRGIETESGKIVATLKAHEPGSKIRCLCAGLVEGEDRAEEWLVSGGFDHKLIVWRTQG
ncbi:hypothetical protein LTR66_003838 [Elasticomyces elasticus]|nr:hypothetical protein LTR66_003838 [Elasticomyces elasticus]